MKKIFVLLFLLPCCIAAYAQWNEATLYTTKSLAKESIKDVYARTSGGSIEVSGATDAEAKLEVYIKPNGSSQLSKDEIKKRLDEDYDLEISVSGGKLTVTAEPKTFNLNSRKQLSIGFRIYVPKNTATDIGTSGGNIALSGLTGDQRFSTSGGNLHLDNLSGKINGKTSGGNISVLNARDYVELSTSGGGIDAEGCSGTIILSTSGGNIDLDKLKGEIRAKTSGGTIRGNSINGELITHTSGGSIKLRAFSGSVDASTSGGNIDMEIAELGKYVTANNSGGNIDVRMPGNKGVDLKLRAENIHINSLTNFSGDKEEHRVNGKINGGGIRVDLSTSGSINLALQ